MLQSYHRHLDTRCEGIKLGAVRGLHRQICIMPGRVPPGACQPSRVARECIKLAKCTNCETVYRTVAVVIDRRHANVTSYERQVHDAFDFFRPIPLG